MEHPKPVMVALALMAIAVCFGATNLAQAQKFVTDGLVSFWTFDQPTLTGDTLKDVWGKNDGILEGNPELVAGKINGALAFDGVDDRVQIPHDPSIDFPDTPFTLEFWFKGTPDTIADDYRILCKGYGGGHGKRYEFEMEGGVSFVIDDNVTKTVLAYPAGGGTISDGSWHHWALVRDIAERELRIYEDSVEAAAGNDQSQSSISSSDPLWLASQDPNDPTAHTDLRCPGTLDELRIYNRVLTPDEIQQNFKVIDNSAAVSAGGKLAVLWGQLKRGDR